MKKIILVFTAYYTVITGCAYGNVDRDQHVGNPSLSESDSAVVFFARKVYNALDKKNKRALLWDKLPAGKEQEKPEIIESKWRGLPKSVPAIMPLTVMMYPGPRAVPVDSLYRFRMEDIDSLNIIFNSPRIGGRYIGRGGYENMVVLMPQGKEYGKVKLDLLKFYGTDRYKDSPWQNDREPDSTLLLFVQDMQSILEEENVRKRGVGQKALDLRRHVMIDNSKEVDIKDLDQYSIFDIAYMTIRFRQPRKRLFRPRSKEGVIFLTTFNNEYGRE